MHFFLRGGGGGEKTFKRNFHAGFSANVNSVVYQTDKH